MRERMRALAGAAPDRALAASILLTGLASAGYGAAGVFRHDHFGSNAYDLGLFDQTVWGYSRFEVVPNTILRLPSALGDHFHPILITLAPLYWLWEDARMLLVAQAVLVAAASVPVFLWGRSRLGALPALGFQAAYLAFWAVLGGTLFDFHEIAFAAPIVSLALYAAVTDRTLVLCAAAVLGFLTREDVTLAFVGIGLYLLLRRRFALALGLIAASLAWFLVAVKAIIPALADRDYQQWYYTRLGAGPGDALAHVVGHPVDTARLLVTPRDKLVSLFNLIGPWLALPLVSPLVVVLLPLLAARLLSDKPSHWAPQGFHYSLVLAPVLAFAAIDTTARLARVAPPRVRPLLPLALAGAVLAAGAYFSFGRLRPLDELERYAAARQIAGIRACLASIPDDVSVAATSALVPHLSQRRRIYVLDHRPPPRTEYLALDLATWRHPLTTPDVRRIVGRALRAGYGVRCSRASSIVLARGARGRRLAPEARRLLALD